MQRTDLDEVAESAGAGGWMIIWMDGWMILHGSHAVDGPGCGSQWREEITVYKGQTHPT